MDVVPFFCSEVCRSIFGHVPDRVKDGPREAADADLAICVDLVASGLTGSGCGRNCGNISFLRGEIAGKTGKPEGCR
jgi:hypothetical protein